MPYDSLNFARKLKRLGVPENQANAHAQILAEFKESHLATKDDIKEFKSETKSEFQSIRTELQEFKVEVKNEIEKMGLKLDAKINFKFLKAQIINGGVMATIAGLLFTALKCFP